MLKNNYTVKKFTKLAFSLLVLFFLTTNSYALSIQHVSHTPIKSSYEAGEEITFHFNIDEPAQVNLNIYDDREYLIRSVKNSAITKSGDHKVHWDGRDASGKVVPGEAYHYTLQAFKGNVSVTHDVTDLTGNDKGILRDLKWDKEKNTISYTLIRASRVNFRVGISGGGPLLRTVVNWQPRQRGRHVETWDGYDESKKFNLAKIPNAQLFSDSYSFSKNTILIGEKLEKSQYVNISSPIERKSKFKSKLKGNKSKTAEDRKDYSLAINLPKSNKQKEHIPVYSGKVSIKIDIPKEELARLHKNRFEPILFVDGQYISELETGFFPVTWQLDTTAFSAGEHYITVNIRGYNGQYGTASQTIFIEHKK